MKKPTFLVPIDFSSDAINALNYAVMIAKKTEASLLLLHAHFAPKSAVDIGTEIYYPEPVDNIQRKIEHRFNSLKAIVPSLTEIDYRFEIAYNQPKNAIINCSENNDFQLIIMGTHGARGIDEVIIGSNTYSAMKETSTPVLMVPGNFKAHKLSNIVLATDFRNTGDDKGLLEFLRQITVAFDAKLNILHIDNDEDFGLNEKEAEQSKTYDEVFQLLNPTYHLLEKQDIETGIEKFAAVNAIDLVVVIPKKHNFLEKIFRSPITKKLAFHSRYPVLALK